MKNVLPGLLLVLLFSCSGKDDLPAGILTPYKMQVVFWDYIRADVYSTEYLKNDSNKNVVIANLKLQEKIFKLHHTTREEFYKSYTWYSNHKELMTMIMDSMITVNKRELNKSKPVVVPL